MSGKDRSIQREFLDGMNEVFTSIFNNDVMLYLMDEENTVVNKLYGETPKKVYKEPTALAAKVVTNFKKDELPEMTVNIDAVITVPTKQLMINNVPCDTMSDLETLKKGKISYKQVSNYMIERVRPKVLIDDEWQFYEFYCYVPKGANA
jgi:hypothetical protein